MTLCKQCSSDSGWGDRITWVQTYEEGLTKMKATYVNHNPRSDTMDKTLYSFMLNERVYLVCKLLYF